MNEQKHAMMLSFEKNNEGMRVFVHGEVDHHSAKLIRDTIDEKIYEDRPKILYINLGDVDFMDSSGLGLIMGRYKLMKLYGGRTYIEDPSHRVLKILELAQMGRIIDIITSK